MSDTLPVPRPLVLRLSYAVGGALVFMVVSTVQGAMRPGYDAWHQAVSALSLGPAGWVQQINFIAFGVVLLSTTPVWRRVLAGGRGETVYPLLTATTAISFIVAAIVRQDPAPGYDPESLELPGPTTLGLIHLGVAGVAATSAVIALFVMAGRFVGDPRWRGWPTYSRFMALLMIVCVVVYGVWSTRASGFAGTFERLAVMATPVWAFTLLRRLWAGTPFMVARTSSLSGRAAAGIRC